MGSEMYVPYYRSAFSESELQQQASTLLFSPNASVTTTELHSLYPRYEPDEYSKKIASVPDDLPLIALSGDMDQAATYEQAVNYTNAVNKTLVTFEEAVHITAFGNIPMK